MKSPQRENFEEAKAEYKRMVKKYGKSTVEAEQPDGSMAEISGYNCPDCEEGTVLVTPRNNTYPPYKKSCSECGEK